MWLDIALLAHSLVRIHSFALARCLALRTFDGSASGSCSGLFPCTPWVLSAFGSFSSLVGGIPTRQGGGRWPEGHFFRKPARKLAKTRIPARVLSRSTSAPQPHSFSSERWWSCCWVVTIAVLHVLRKHTIGLTVERAWRGRRMLLRKLEQKLQACAGRAKHNPKVRSAPALGKAEKRSRCRAGEELSTPWRY